MLKEHLASPNNSDTKVDMSQASTLGSLEVEATPREISTVGNTDEDETQLEEWLEGEPMEVTTVPGTVAYLRGGA